MWDFTLVKSFPLKTWLTISKAFSPLTLIIEIAPGLWEVDIPTIVSSKTFSSTPLLSLYQKAYYYVSFLHIINWSIVIFPQQFKL